ncbi:VlmB-like protein [Actinophytocola sediminis]
MITDWDQAPGLLAGAAEVELTAREANLRYWLTNVPQGTLVGRPDGFDPALTLPTHMLAPRPLRDAIAQEYAFRSAAEDRAARALSYLVASAPDTDTMEFYATQLLDEARHAMVFRNHLLSLGVTDFDAAAGADIRSILDPLEEHGLSVIREDFIGGVVMMAIIIEGALAPAAELSERKWAPLNPIAAEIDRGAGIDEIRHLTVGASIAREHLLAHPEDRERVRELITAGMHLWTVLPVHEMVLRREILFQRGLEEHADTVGDYEIWPGRRLIDTTPEERLATADRWSTEMKESHLRYIGIEDLAAPS